MTVALSDPPALNALRRLTGSDRAVDAIVRRFTTWDELVSASAYELVARVGPWAAPLRVPSTCPDLPDHGVGIRVLSRYHAEQGIGDYPRALLGLAMPPVLLSARGRMPLGTLVAIGGSWRPGPAAKQRAEAAAVAAVNGGHGVAAALDGGCGSAAIKAALRRGGVVCAVSGGALGAVGADSLTMDAIVESGGGVISAVPVGDRWSQTHLAMAGSLAAALGSVAVTADFGPFLGGGLSFAQEALSNGRRLVGFATGSREVLPHGTTSLLVGGRREVDALGQVDLPAGIAGIQRADLSGYLGTPMADHVVRNDEELVGAIREGVLAV